jgi:hypothetical protein
MFKFIEEQEKKYLPKLRKLLEETNKSLPRGRQVYIKDSFEPIFLSDDDKDSMEICRKSVTGF